MHAKYWMEFNECNTTNECNVIIAMSYRALLLSIAIAAGRNLAIFSQQIAAN